MLTDCRRGIVCGGWGPGSEVEISSHVLNILQRARELCLSRELPKISELGLVCGFAREADGGAWKILRELRVTSADLDPWRTAIAQMTIGSVAGLTPSMCSKQAWAILNDAAQRGLRAGLGGVSAIHLFQAMASEQNGLLADSLRRLGISLSLDSRGSSDTTDSLDSDAAGEQIRGVPET